MSSMLCIQDSELKKIRDMYPVGCRVRLERMNDPYVIMPAGLEGTVTGVDSIGSVHVNWDNGSSLAVIYGHDIICRI